MGLTDLGRKIGISRLKDTFAVFTSSLVSRNFLLCFFSISAAGRGVGKGGPDEEFDNNRFVNFFNNSQSNMF